MLQYFGNAEYVSVGFVAGVVTTVLVVLGGLLAGLYTTRHLLGKRPHVARPVDPALN